MKRVLLCIFIFLVVLSSGCNSSLVDTSENTNIKTDLFEEEKVYSSADNDHILIGEFNYNNENFRAEIGAPSLDEYYFYYAVSDKKYNLVAKFNSDVAKSEVENFKSYFLNLFISLSGSRIGEVPYEKELLYGKDRIYESKTRPYKRLSFRVYVSEIKAFRYDYDLDNKDDYKYWVNEQVKYK